MKIARRIRRLFRIFVISKKRSDLLTCSLEESHPILFLRGRYFGDNKRIRAGILIALVIEHCKMEFRIKDI
jgi:hypothetical protein